MAVLLDRVGVDALIAALRDDGRSVLGPTARDDAVHIGPIRSTADLPGGVQDEQSPGHYRLRPGAPGRLFDHATPADSWKQVLHPPRTLVLRVRRRPDEGGTDWEAPEPDPEPLALFGVRPCDLAAMLVLDRVLLGGDHAEPTYAARRDAVIVAVDCGTPSATCACTSAGGGPRVGAGHDMALTELPGSVPAYVARAGTDRGAELLERVPGRPATAGEVAAADGVCDGAAASITRRFDLDALRGLPVPRPGDDVWEEAERRCLACGACTMVCPTCPCTTVEDTSDLLGTSSERWQRWDTCFRIGFSELHGGAARESLGARYRQWLTHKLATWQDQHGTPGCVGCGRCTTWCPVGIDLVAMADRWLAGHR